MKFSTIVGSAACLVAVASSWELTEKQKFNANRTLSIGYVVFPGYQILDVFGPLDLIYSASRYYKINLSIIAEKVGPVGSKSPPAKSTMNMQHPPNMPPMNASQQVDVNIIATHDFQTAPKLDVMLVTGGMGNRYLVQNNKTALEDFLRERFDETEYTMSVCTGATMLARAGILNGRRATTNKMAWAWGTSYGTNITWVPSARWVEDGKVWTSSGVAAGIDMTAAWIKHFYSEAIGNDILNGAEYTAHTDAHWDAFSVVHKVPGAETNRSLIDCVGPAPDLW